MKIYEDLFPAGTQGTKKPGYYIDGLLHSNLSMLKDAVQKDWDGLVLVDGVEGSGKSVLAQQCAFFCDPTLTIERVCFTPDDFKEQVIKAKKYQAVIYDEAYGGLASRKTMSDTNHSIVAMLAEIRQKNLFIFVVMPSFFDLDKYAALWRSRALLHVYSDGFDRGFFKFYSYAKKKDMYVQGKKFYSYKCVKADFSGRFTNFYPLGQEEYRAKKAKSLHRHISDPVRHSVPSIARQARKELLAHMVLKAGVSRQKAAKLTGLSRTAVNEYVKEVSGGPAAKSL